MRLNSDNPDTMPITDSVYGKKKAQPSREQRVPAERQLWQALSLSGMNGLSKVGGKEAKRLYHIRSTNGPRRGT